MAKTVLGVIGGSGVYEFPGLRNERWERVESPWGEPSDELHFGELPLGDGKSVEMVFLPRHGRGHPHSPTTINYRANIDAMKRAGVTDIISVSAVGSLKEELDSRSSEDRTFRKKAGKALKSSAHFPRRGVETGYRRKLDLRDLGELSQAFASEEFGSEVTESSKNLEKAYKGAVIDVVRGPGYESASGLSVKGSSVMEKQGFSFFGLF